jgi:hypothetical protein
MNNWVLTIIQHYLAKLFFNLIKEGADESSNLFLDLSQAIISFLSGNTYFYPF